MSYELATQQAIYSALVQSDSLSSLVSGRIYDHVPQKPTFPYVSIGEDSFTAWDTSTTRGATILATINTWSRAKGLLETKSIQGAIYTALHAQDIEAQGYIFTDCQRDSGQSFLDADGITRHGVSVFRVLVSTI